MRNMMAIEHKYVAEFNSAFNHVDGDKLRRQLREKLLRGTAANKKAKISAQ
jgi:hypothetical protein